jgi:hypothetical protein
LHLDRVQSCNKIYSSHFLFHLEEVFHQVHKIKLNSIAINLIYFSISIISEINCKPTSNGSSIISMWHWTSLNLPLIISNRIKLKIVVCPWHHTESLFLIKKCLQAKFNFIFRSRKKAIEKWFSNNFFFLATCCFSTVTLLSILGNISREIKRNLRDVREWFCWNLSTFALI